MKTNEQWIEEFDKIFYLPSKWWNRNDIVDFISKILEAKDKEMAKYIETASMYDKLNK